MIGIGQIISNDELPFIDFGNGAFNNDWIILKLESPLTLDENVQPACLPSDSTFLPLTASKQQCWTSGWGALSSTGNNNFSVLYFSLSPLFRSSLIIVWFNFQI